MYLDIGANIGKWSMANSDTTDRIIAVEASPNIYSDLKKNTKNKNIECLNYAVCDNDEKDITFYESIVGVLSTINKDWLVSGTSRFCDTGYREITCKTTTLDKLIELYGLPELIKIDVEGGEYSCIKTLSQKVDNLCFEWASEVNDITFQCLDHLCDIGFTGFHIQHEDEYTYRPSCYTSANNVKNQLIKMTPKVHWGMIWCK
jgi:FkbM family methyltransferase